ncbi:hypothetical protein [Bradyrhizobium sp. URHD0069]|uniref:hypothetical protein n=1 Tax=Bradyrhizobium sp. URHD0069 TaxID=1380355 RepID=UPI0012DFA117|nr:hypothetical protein [Bradyrhizobium sp. URHD0069]
MDDGNALHDRAFLPDRFLLVSLTSLQHIGMPRNLKLWGRFCMLDGRNGSFSHGHSSSSPSKTLRAAMGCSVQFPGNPSRTKERWIESLTINTAPRAARAKEKPASRANSAPHPAAPTHKA